MTVLAHQAGSEYLLCMNIRTIEECVGRTPLVRLKKLYTGPSDILMKLEGNNPAGSVKDRPALNMILEAERDGRIRGGDTLIEATSGNTGIALAMVAAVRGYRMILVMPEHMSSERRALMKAYGAELVLTSRAGSMEESIETARKMEAKGEGIILNQFANESNPLAHYRTTGPEIWQDTDGTVSHFIASTGTTGTIMGTGRYLKERNPEIQIIGAVPDASGGIPGIRAWSPEYQPAIYDAGRLDDRREVSSGHAEQTARELAAQEGIFAGISSGGNAYVALQIATEWDRTHEHPARIVTIACDRGDRYLSTGVFPA